MKKKEIRVTAILTEEQFLKLRKRPDDELLKGIRDLLKSAGIKINDSNITIGFSGRVPPNFG